MRKSVLALVGVGSLTMVATMARYPVMATTAATGTTPTSTSPTGRYGTQALLPNGRLVDPAGRLTTVGDFPVAMAESPDGNTLVIANSGQGEGSNPDQGNQSLDVVDAGTGKLVQRVRDHEPGPPTFY